MPALVTNNATSTLASGISAVDVSLTVATGEGAYFPSPTGADYFYCTLAGSAGIEIVKVTARATDTFTITRAQDGTIAKAFTAGETVEVRPVAALFDIDALLPDQTSAANKLLVSSGTTVSWSSNLSGLTLATPTLTGATVADYMVLTGSVNVLGGTFPGVLSSQFFGTSARFGLVRTTSAANERVWDFAIGAASLYLRAVNDIDSVQTTLLRFDRTGTVASSMVVGSAQSRFQDGLVTAPGVTFDIDPDTGMYRAATNTLGFAVNGGVGLVLSTTVLAIGAAATPVSAYAYGNMGANIDTATTAGGHATAGFLMGTAALRVTWGSGAPTTSAPQGSLYLRTDGSSTSTRAYINTNGTTGWTAITTAT
jgi:hypothetical protein